METKYTKTYLFVRILIILALFFFIILNLKQCNSINESAKTILLEKSNDSLSLVFKMLKLSNKKLQIQFELANLDLLDAQNQSQISETKLASLQRQRTRPLYVPEIVNCNDTIQSLYDFSMKKDSASKVVIFNKTFQIIKLDTIIKIQEREKNNLTDYVKDSKIETDNLKSIIEIKNKEFNIQKRKNTFLNYTVYAGWLFAGYLAIKK